MKTSRALLPHPANLFIWLNAAFMLYGIFGLNWKPETVMIAYFLETIIIGIIHVVKLLTVWKFGQFQRTVEPSKGVMSNFGAIPFFIVHYFFFIFVQSIFIFIFMKGLAPGMKNEFSVFENYGLLLAQPDVLIAFSGLFITNMAYALRDFFIPRKFHTTTLEKLFLQPYVRIFIQQFVTILSGFFILFNGGAIIAVVLLIFTRLIIDLYLNAAARSKEMRAAIINSLSKGKPDKDREDAEEAFDSFLQ